MANDVPLDEHDVILGEGWALREDKPRKRFSDDVKNWLNDKFDAGLTPDEGNMTLKLWRT